LTDKELQSSFIRNGPEEITRARRTSSPHQHQHGRGPGDESPGAGRDVRPGRLTARPPVARHGDGRAKGAGEAAPPSSGAGPNHPYSAEDERTQSAAVDRRA